ncbi:carbohydrate ABC transporter permease [Paenibacillus sp. GCM10027626]|uniref:carbohydrate ABC transporter permease n=1 Tax=Paenibacillus sp. GCM10027626 TaxID=3273411 RepID=UPI00362558AD
MKSKGFTLEQKKSFLGILFVTPWLIGFIFLFAVPMFQSFQFSLSKLTVTQDGFSLTGLGWENYRSAVLSHATYNRVLTESVVNMALNVPLIIIFSLFSAVLLNQKFRGRALARAIFFLPVILASGVIANLDANDYMAQVIGASSPDTSSSFNLMRNMNIIELLLESGMSPAVVGYLLGAVNRIYEIISASGVQILIFLAGLQSISPTLYEASKIEGATGYESFWKITFPMMSPLILTNVLYTIIDSFLNNKMTTLLYDTAFKNHDFGLSAAMSWIYFIVIAMILVVTTYVLSKRVSYQD